MQQTQMLHNEVYFVEDTLQDENKFRLARKLHDFNPRADKNYALLTNIYGIKLKWNIQSREFYHQLCAYFPASWIAGADEVDLFSDATSITWLSSKQLGCDEDFTQDANPFCRFCGYKNAKLIIQRDFIASQEGRQIMLLAQQDLSDGFHNFLRWLLPQQLLKSNKFLLHSSAITMNKESAYVCLGASGAGKTTIASMAKADCVLGDDMNLVELINGQWQITPAVVGQRIQSRDLINKKFLIKAFFVLEKSINNKLTPLSKVESFIPISISFANLQWEQLEFSDVNRAQDMMLALINSNNFYKLQFNLDRDVWGYIEHYFS